MRYWSDRLCLKDRFNEVWAVDQEAEMIEFERRKAERLGVSNIRWVVQRAELLASEAGSFDLIAVGNAFHRPRRAEVARNALEWLKPGGFLALLWSYVPWNGDEEWQVVASAVVREWSERSRATERIPGNLDQAVAAKPHDAVLSDAGFDVLGKFEFPTLLSWTPESLAGFAYSTSVLPRSVLGSEAARFEADLRERLLSVDPSGVFHQLNTFAYQLASVPG